MRWMGTGIACLLLARLAPALAQSELKTEFNLTGGGEYNIFKSPDVLYNNETDEYWDRDSLLISDMLADVGYDIDFLKEKDNKYAFSLGSDLWYRYYLNYDELSQTRLNAYTDYTRLLGKKIHLGLFYNFRWSDRVGSSVTGDLLMRSFKYLGNEAKLYLDILPSKKLSMRLFSRYQYKIYYDENTFDPLDHANLEFSYSINAEPARKHEVNMELSLLDRYYTHYHALDASGTYDRISPLRHFRYFAAQLDYSWKPMRGFRINPELEVKRRVDMFEGYYSYFSYGGGLRIRYMRNGFYISLYGDYKLLNYDIREAFSSHAVNPMLEYGYFDYSLTMKHKLSRQWEISLRLNSDARSSNSDLEDFRTRRGYNNYEALIGINYALPDMKWK